ncbi:MAG: phosphate signaling complex protein PhoU [Betaproteobacteria bacterium]|jgi:phosphate transport system protein|uniref:phosphate signaling complex protein PhoU n=1 Tax=Thiomonas sp. TaxID=2047785 RepID=UPI000BD6C7BB|nr:phosphate signaling complex protein PhoU [Thiomonas sp.]MDE2128817.1 phosphate signaling complex protein PhoU [Betaproteobacteria bacterium]OZB44397.1 MAG: phosphate transport system regulatory protein PhoU [Thiomonas sp. 15-66-11]
MGDKHISTQFDAEISALSTQVLEMGGLVESQIGQAVFALRHFDIEAARGVMLNEKRVNQMEVDIDADVTQIIAKRQPTARDLRLMMAISKTITNLERVGDEADRIARMARDLIEAGSNLGISFNEITRESDLAIAQIRKALDAFARLDEKAAVEIVSADSAIDDEFDSFMRKLITYVMEDPRNISSSLDLVFIAKAIERIGDHAKNIAEFVIYVVRGTDVRHNKAAFNEVASTL